MSNSWIEEAINRPDPFAAVDVGAAAAEAHAQRIAEADPEAEAAVDRAVAEHATTSSADGRAALDRIAEEDAERERERIAKLRGPS